MSRTLAIASGSYPGPVLSRAPGAAVDLYARGDVEGYAARRPDRLQTNNMPPHPQAYWRPTNASDLSSSSSTSPTAPIASSSTMQVEPFQSPPSLLYRRSLVEDPAFSRVSSHNPERWVPQGAIDPEFLRGSYVVPFPAGVLSPPLGAAQHSPESEPSSFASSSTSLGMRTSPPTSIEDDVPPSASTARLAYLDDGDESPQSSPEHTHIILPSRAAREKMEEAERERAAVAMGAKEREAYDFARSGPALQRAPSSGKGRDLPAPPATRAIEECPPYEESVSPGTGSTTLAGHPVNRLARTEKGAPLVLSYHAPPPPSPSPEPPSMPLRKPDHKRVQEPTPEQASSSKGKQARKPPAAARRHSSKAPPRDLDIIDELDESNPYNVAMRHHGPYDAIPRSGSRDPRAGKAAKAHRHAPPAVDNPLKLNLKPGQVLSGSIFQPPTQHRPSFSQPLNIFSGPPYQPAQASRPHPHFASPPHESPYQHEHSLSTPRGSHSSLHATSAPAPAPQPVPPMPYLDPALFPDLNGASTSLPAPGRSSTSPASLPTAKPSRPSPNPPQSNSKSSPSLPSSQSNSSTSVPSASSASNSNPNLHSVNATFPPNRRTSLHTHSYTSSPNGSSASLAESVSSTKRGAHSRPPSFVGAKRPDSYHAGQTPGTDSFYAQGRQAHDSFFGPQTPPQVQVGLHARTESAPANVSRGGSYQEYQQQPPMPPMPTPVQPPRERASMPPPSPLGVQPRSTYELPPQTREQARHASMPPPASPAMVSPSVLVTPPGEEPAMRYEAPSSRLAMLNATGSRSNVDIRTGSNLDVRTGFSPQPDPRSVSSLDVRSQRTGASSVRTGGSQGPLAPRHVPRKLVMPSPLSAMPMAAPAPPPILPSHSHSSHGHESHSPSSNHGHGSSHGHGSNHGHGMVPAAPPYLPRGAAPPAPDGAPAVRFAQAAVQPVPLPTPPVQGHAQSGLKKAATITRYDEGSRGNLLKKKNVPAPSERARSVSPVKEKSGGGFFAAVFGFGEKEKGGVRRAQSVIVREAPVVDVKRSVTLKVGKEEKEKPRRLLSKRR